MSVFQRIRRLISPAPTRASSPPSSAPAPEEEGETAEAAERRRRGLASWVEKRAKNIAKEVYSAQADDIETRARRAVSSAYEDRADDLEERAVRAMRRALAAESERIKEIIEHSVRVKKREVRLSLVVLITAALLYLALDWYSHRPGA